MNQSIEINVSGNLLHVHVTGKLNKEAYEELVPAVDQLVKDEGKLRILLELRDFHGWTAGALWEDLKFDLKHWKDIERLAIVGDSKWEEGMAVFCKPFTVAKIQFFLATQLDEARVWIEGN